jgi:hypothetical protein
MNSFRARLLVGLLVAGWVGPCSWAAGATAVVEVPFEFYRNSIVVQAKVNGHGPFSMLLDTGADPSIIDIETAREIGLKLGTEGAQGSGGGTDANLAYETALPILEAHRALLFQPTDPGTFHLPAADPSAVSLS